MRISIGLLAVFLVGCSGTEPNFLYNQAQADQAVKEVTEITSQPIQKFITGVDLTDGEKSKLESAIPLIDEIIKYDPVSLNSYNLKGKIYLALGKQTEAKMTFIEGMAVSVQREDETSKLIRSDTCVELAKIHFAEKDYKSAEQAANTAITLLDNDPMPHVILGRIFQINKNMPSAKNEALRALLINADSEPARVLFRDLNPSLKVSP